MAELSRIKERILSPQGQYSLYDSYIADIKFKYCETETSFYYVTRLEKRRDIVVKYRFNDITEDMYTYEYAPYVEFPKNVITNILSFITFNKANYEYKRTIVIKDVKLKYLGVTMYDNASGVFHGSAFEFNDDIVRS